jgi:AcrR family transcriptional regulator
MVQPAEVKQTRRPRGEPRRLLLQAARELFARQDYRSTTTREIADHAGVLEHLLFRNFGSKAALFREALVVPFVDVVESFHATWPTIRGNAREEDVASDLHGTLYDLFVENRGLVMTLLAADALSDEELAEIGIHDLRRAVAILGRLGDDGIDIVRGAPSQHHELAARSTLAMIAGMAAFGATLFDGEPPSRDEIVEELTQMTLHGFLHRQEG